MAVMIPIEHTTVAELRAHAYELLKADELAREPGRIQIHNFAMRLISEVARLRDTEVVICKTKWSDSEPPEPAEPAELAELAELAEPQELQEPPSIELLELTQMMAPSNTYDAMCSKDLRLAGLAYPRHCARCGLGPCYHTRDVQLSSLDAEGVIEDLRRELGRR